MLLHVSSRRVNRRRTNPWGPGKRPDDDLKLALRLRDGATGALVPTRSEARLQAEARVAQLEAELARRGHADASCA